MVSIFIALKALIFLGNRSPRSSTYPHRALGHCVERNPREGAGDIPDDLKGKQFLVTGGSSGLGLAAVVELLKRNATVHVLVVTCRAPISTPQA